MMDDFSSSNPADSRFERALAELLKAEERGEPLGLSRVVQEAPDLETPLREFFRNRDGFDRLAPHLAEVSARSVAAAELPALSEAGRYRLEGVVGEGGMGRVFRAHDSDFHRPLAVKVLKREFKDRPDLVARFLEEAQITGQLQHPGIPPVHEIGRLPDGRPFLAMKLIEGRTLHDLVRSRTPGEELAHFLTIFAQVCQTLAYAHARRVIHRDLKPENIMVGAFGEVQVMDWGLAKVAGPAEADSEPSAAPRASTLHPARRGTVAEPTEPGMVLGTLAYMPPEQARGEVDRVDEASDVFGLGAILCVILTGEPPYRGRRPQELWEQARSADLRDAFARLDGCGADAELVALARRCLAKDQAERPSHAGVVAREVEAYLASVQARLRAAELADAEARAKVAEERKRRRVTLALAVTVLGSMLLGGGAGTWLVWSYQQKARAEEARQRAEADRRRALEERDRIEAQLVQDVQRAWPELQLKLKEIMARYTWHIPVVTRDYDSEWLARQVYVPPDPLGGGFPLGTYDPLAEVRGALNTSPIGRPIRPAFGPYGNRFGPRYGPSFYGPSFGRPSVLDSLRFGVPRPEPDVMAFLRPGGRSAQRPERMYRAAVQDVIEKNGPYQTDVLNALKEVLASLPTENRRRLFWQRYVEPNGDLFTEVSTLPGYQALAAKYATTESGRPAPTGGEKGFRLIGSTPATMR